MGRINPNETSKEKLLKEGIDEARDSGNYAVLVRFWGVSAWH